jgi:hypothetical protein
MQADYSVELGADDPVLEFPWPPDDAGVRYYDLKRHPDLVNNIPEARDNPDLGKFLSRINAANFPLQTAKCDTWFSHEISAEEEIFGATCKFSSYVDLLFVADKSRTSFAQHESLAKKLCNLLQHVPEMAAAVELIIRRCVYRQAGPLEQENTLKFEIDTENATASLTSNANSGFYITAYVCGFAASEEDANKHWRIALNLLQYALVQISNG